MRTTWSAGAKNPRNRIPCAHRAYFFVQNPEVARTQGVAVPSLAFFHLQLATMEESGIGVGKGRPGERAGGRLGGGGCTRSPEHGGARQGWAHGRPWQLDAGQGDAANPGPTRACRKLGMGLQWRGERARPRPAMAAHEEE
jgi:hypothetical protein